jgi:hypothetical protein
MIPLQLHHQNVESMRQTCIKSLSNGCQTPNIIFTINFDQHGGSFLIKELPSNFNSAIGCNCNLKFESWHVAIVTSHSDHQSLRSKPDVEYLQVVLQINQKRLCCG